VIFFSFSPYLMMSKRGRVIDERLVFCVWTSFMLDMDLSCIYVCVDMYLFMLVMLCEHVFHFYFMT